MGRDKGQRRNPPFVAVKKDMLRSQAWLALSSSAKVAWLHIALDQRSRDDQHLRLPYSQAEQLMDRKTFRKAVKELIEKRFIIITKLGGLRGAGDGESDCNEYGLTSGWRDWHQPEEKLQKKAKGGNPPRPRVEIHPEKPIGGRA